MREAASSGWSMLRGTIEIEPGAHCYVFIFLLSLFSLTVNGGYNHCHLISEKNNMMDVEMTNSLGSMCRQNLLRHSGNSFTRDHPLPCERLLHVSQLNLSCSDTRYCFQFWLHYLCYHFWSYTLNTSSRVWPNSCTVHHPMLPACICNRWFFINSSMLSLHDLIPGFKKRNPPSLFWLITGFLHFQICRPQCHSP